MPATDAFVASQIASVAAAKNRPVHLFERSRGMSCGMPTAPVVSSAGGGGCVLMDHKSRGARTCWYIAFCRQYHALRERAAQDGEDVWNSGMSLGFSCPFL